MKQIIYTIIACCIIYSQAFAFGLMMGKGSTVESGSTFTFIAKSDYDSASSTTASASAPTGTQDDDIMIALLFHHFDAATASVPSGWSTIAPLYKSNDTFIGLYRKVASSESGSYEWTFSTASRTSLTIATYRGGFDTTDPIDTYSNDSYGTSDEYNPAGTVTVSANKSPLLVIGGEFSGTILTHTAPASPGTFNEDVEFGDTTGDHSRFFYSQTVDDSGATGTMTVTISSSVAPAYKHTFGLVLNPE